MSLTIKLQQLEDDVDLFHDIVHGDALEVVVTDGGNVNSAAKTMADIVAEFAAMIAEVQSWANEAENVEIEPGLYSAFHFAQKASGFADDASGFADDAEASAIAAAVFNPASVAITGGTITGITDLAIGDGGTGASTAAGARTALGLDSAGFIIASATNIISRLSIERDSANDNYSATISSKGTLEASLNNGTGDTVEFKSYWQGTLTVSFAHRIHVGSSESFARVLKNGVEEEEWSTNSITHIARTVDVEDVEIGDIITIQQRRTGSTTYMQDCYLKGVIA